MQRMTKDKSHQRGRDAPSRLRPWLMTGIALAAGLTLLGALASWFPALDLVNDFMPALVAASVALLLLSAYAGERSLIIYAAFITTINAAFMLGSYQAGAPQAQAGSARFLRVATFNLWYHNDRIADVGKFLAATDADVIVLQEMTDTHWQALAPSLEARYPHRLGDNGLVLLSKHPIVEQGRIDRGGGHWHSPILRWVKIEVQGKPVVVAGVHLARPVYPALQATDSAALTAFARQHAGPLVVAGDFSLTPWTHKLTRFSEETGLAHLNTFHPTWPMQKRGIPLVPFFAIDNVLASQDFAKIAVEAGPRLGSDHRPIVADLALRAP
jgi:endonuclease/exonuclease/phosphatase (EEP) superfamily protein YafD